jgi:pantothenate kinase-related protein Tda10
VPARVLAGMSDSGILCFVTAFMKRYECLCQLSLERSYNCVSVYVTIDTVCWLYYV